MIMYIVKLLQLGDRKRGDYWDRRWTRMFFNLSISSVSSFSLIWSIAFSDSSSPTRSNMVVFFAFCLARETWDVTLFFCLRVSLVFLASGALSPKSESKSLASLALSRFGYLGCRPWLKTLQRKADCSWWIVYRHYASLVLSSSVSGVQGYTSLIIIDRNSPRPNFNEVGSGDYNL